MEIDKTIVLSNGVETVSYTHLKDYENLIIVDFICRAIDSPKAWRKYLDTFDERYESKVVYAKAKSKEYGWRNLTQKVILENGKHLYETKNKQLAQIGSFITCALSRPCLLYTSYTFSLKEGFIVDGTPGFVLQPYDEVYVRRSPGYQAQQNVVVEGEILFGGSYAMTSRCLLYTSRCV